MFRVDETKCIVSMEDILMVCSFPKDKGHNFLVYRNSEDDNTPIHINTNFTPELLQENISVGITYGKGTGYDRGIAKSEPEFDNMTIKELHRLAYNAWMDGAK